MSAPPEEDLEEKDPPRRRRWPWVILFFLALLIGGLLWLNGPGARLLIEKALPAQLQKFGLSGHYEISGNLSSGLTLENVDLTGDQMVKKATADLIDTDYQLSELLNGKARAITIHGLDLIIDLDQLPENDKEPVPLMETLNSFRKFVTPVTLDLKDITIRLEKEDFFARLALESLTHSGGADKFVITGLETESTHTGTHQSPPATIAWKEDLLTVDQLDLVPDLGIRDLRIDENSLLKTDLLLAQTRFSATSNLKNQHSLTLKTPPFDLELITPYLPEDLKIDPEGLITTLQLQARFPDEGEGMLKLDLGATGLNYDKYLIKTLTTQIDLDKGAATFKSAATFNIEDTLAGEFSASGTGSLADEPENSTAQLQWELVTEQYPALNGTARWAENKAHLTATALETGSLEASFDKDAGTFKAAATFDIEDTLAGEFSASGTGSLADEPENSTAQLQWELVTEQYPALSGTARWAENKAHLTATALETVFIQASFDTVTQQYQAEVKSELDRAIKLIPDLTSARFFLKGGGDLKAGTHQGEIDLKNIAYEQKENPPIIASGQGSWNWPEQFSFKDLLITRDGVEARSSLTWKEGFARFSDLSITDGQGSLLTGKGSLPLPLQARNLDDLLANQKPLDFALSLEPVPLSRFDPTLSGKANAKIRLGGSFSKPAIDGKISATQVAKGSFKDLPPTDLEITLKTVASELILAGSIVEPGGRLLDLSGSFPLKPEKWIKDPDSLKQEKLSFRADTPRIDLRRFAPFVPKVKNLAGIAEINVAVGGTIDNPDLSGEAYIKTDRARLSTSPISDFRNSEVRLKFRGDTVQIAPSQVTAAGGEINFSGSVKLGETPVFDLTFKGDNVLVWRDSAYSLRSDPSLTLKGPLSGARIEGSIPLVESMIYKDVEILPFGVPTKEIERPKVPDLSAVSRGDLYTLPEPFASWPVNVTVTTKDPVLIRGNLITGELVADARLGGTLGKIKTYGTISSRDLEADLPFSKLVVQNGIATLNPESLLEPSLSVRGTAKVSGYDVQVYVTGTASKPSLSLTSEPPLPESEILLLLSTGSTASALNNRSLASQKALQYLIEGLRKRYGKQDAKSLLQRFLKNLDEVDFSLGDYNRFSGRHFTSATIELDDQWALSTSIDEEGHTRSMVIFSLRFR